MTAAFIHGLVLALGLIMPLGVQNFFVFSQGATNSRFTRTVSVVVTAALCDTVLILLAILGVTLIMMKFVWLQTIIISAGIVFLFYLGWLTWRSRSDGRPEINYESYGAARLVGFTVMISLLNPHAILDTIGVIGTSSTNYEAGEKIAFAAACLIVSWAWFFGLAFAGKLLGKKDKNGKLLNVLNKISAFIMWGAALYMLRLLA